MNALSPYSIRKTEEGAFIVSHEIYGPVAGFGTDKAATAFVLGTESAAYYGNETAAYLMGQKEKAFR